MKLQSKLEADFICFDVERRNPIKDTNASDRSVCKVLDRRYPSITGNSLEAINDFGLSHG